MSKIYCKVVAESRGSLILAENEASRSNNVLNVSEKKFRMTTIHGLMYSNAIFIAVRCCVHAMDEGLSS